MNDKQTKVIAFRGDSGACWYYRLHLPLQAVAKNNPNFKLTVSTYVSKEQIQQFDVAIFQRQYTQDVLDAAKVFRKYGMKLIYEVDDDLFHIPEWNPAYKELSAPAVQKIFTEFLRMVDAIFVTTPYLKSIYARYNENIYVLPNAVRFNAFAKPPLNSTKDVVLWMGSSTHKNDLKIMEPTFKRLTENKDLMLKLWSSVYPGAYTVPMVAFQDWHAMFSQMDASIGLAPIIPHVFNRSKSNLKFLEYTAQGMVTIASDFGEYSDIIQHGINGFLVKNNNEWYDTIQTVRENPDLMVSVVAAARKYVSENYDLDKLYVLWQDAILDVVNRPSVHIDRRIGCTAYNTTPQTAL